MKTTAKKDWYAEYVAENKRDQEARAARFEEDKAKIHSNPDYFYEIHPFDYFTADYNILKRLAVCGKE